MSTSLEVTKDALEAAGFTAAAEILKAKAEKARKLALAYEHYRYVPQEAVDKFNAKLKAASLKMQGTAGRDLYHYYDQLTFTPVKDYQNVPPSDVLEAAKEASGKAIFDALEVAHVVSVREYKDPILFGRIDGCTDRFYLAQWGDDVSINDLLDVNEG